MGVADYGTGKNPVILNLIFTNSMAINCRYCGWIPKFQMTTTPQDQSAVPMLLMRRKLRLQGEVWQHSFVLICLLGVLTMLKQGNWGAISSQVGTCSCLKLGRALDRCGILGVQHVQLLMTPHYMCVSRIVLTASMWYDHGTKARESIHLVVFLLWNWPMK